MAVALAQAGVGISPLSTQSSITMTLGGAPTAGNLLYAVVAAGNLTGYNTPAGWTRIDQDLSINTGSGVTTFYRIVQAGDPAGWTFTPTSTQFCGGVLYEISGQDPINPINQHGVTPENANQSTYTTPTLTPSTPNCLPIATFPTAHTPETLTPQAGWTSDFNNTVGIPIASVHNSVTSSSVTVTCGLSVGHNGHSVLVLIAPALPPQASVASLTFLDTTAAPQTFYVSEGALNYSIVSGNTGICTVAPSTGTTDPASVVVTPVGIGSTVITITDSNSNTATVNVNVNFVISLMEIEFDDALTGTVQAFQVTESGFGGTFKATSSDPTVCTVTPGSAAGPGPVTFSVVSGRAGTALISVSDGVITLSVRVIVTLSVSTPAADGTQQQSLVLKFTGFLETDTQDMKDPFSLVKSAELIDLTKQFRFECYDTLPHPIYGNQTLAYFDPSYNLTNPLGDGKTWVCDGKMFTVGVADPVYGASHIAPAVFVDTTGGSSPASVALSNSGYVISGSIGTCTNYVFNYRNGTLTFTSAGLTALGFPGGLPANAVVSMAGNPTYMAPEVMIRKMLVEKASWSPGFLKLDTSNVLLPMYTCEDQALWLCLQDIAEQTNPRFVPWQIWADEQGVIHFYETRYDGPPVKKYVDERDILSCSYEQTSRQLRTVVRADGAIATTSGDQSVTSISYDIEAINKYGTTEAEQIKKNLTLNVRNLAPFQAVSYLNMLTASVLAQMSRPSLTLNCEVWPDPTIQIGDKIQVRSKRVGTDRYYVVAGLEEQIHEGQYKQTLVLEEYYESTNYFLGLPSATGFGNSQGSVVAPPSTAVIGAVTLGNGPGTMCVQYGQYVKDPQTGDQILPVWDLSDPSPMLFNVYLNSLPTAATAAGVPTGNSNPGQFGYHNLPPGCNWTPRVSAIGNVQFYGISPGGNGYPTAGLTVCCLPDSRFFSFAHIPPITTADLTSPWFPNTNINPACGAPQNYTGITSFVYLWQWWYLCLDGNAGVGKDFRPVQRVNPAVDGTSLNIPSTGGYWSYNSWAGPAGPVPANTAGYNKTYANVVVGITDYTTPPAGFVGANVFATSAPVVNYGVAFGADATPGKFYLDYQKQTRGHFCVLAASSTGAVQFLRIPFVVNL